MMGLFIEIMVKGVTKKEPQLSYFKIGVYLFD